MENTMKYLIKFLAIIGLVSMSHVAVAIDNVSDGDILTAAGVNEVIDATNANTDAIQELTEIVNGSTNLDFDITSAGPPCGGGTVYKVGDIGPATGLVFFVTTDGCDGLEAWLVDEPQSNWGCFGTNVGASGKPIGTGAPNSLVIENAGCIGVSDTVPAIRNVVKGGESDWYLPSIGELKHMYQTIGPGAINVGNFVDTRVYWSSTEYDGKPDENVWVVDFVDGNDLDNPKAFNRFARAIRTFRQ
jgi:hypothetical protein